MPRVLIAGFCSVPGPDRAAVQMQHVIRALTGGNAVDVLVMRSADQAYVERSGQARILRVPVSDADWRQRVETFRRAVRRQLEGADYDIVHIRDGWAGLPVFEMREQLGCATVFDSARSPLVSPLRLQADEATELARAEEICIRHADMVLAPTEPAMRFLTSLCPAERLHVVPPGVDVDAFDWDYPQVAGPPRILHMGSLDPGGGAELAVAAMAKIAPHSDAILILAGEGSSTSRRKLAALVQSLGLADRIELHGPVDHAEVPALIATASVCVAAVAAELSPRPTVLYPTKILEYMACRRPVVAPRRGSVALIVRDRQHALLFNPGDADDLASQCLKLLSDRELAAKFAFTGYDMVRRECTASGTRRAIRRAYQWLGEQPRWAEQFSKWDGNPAAEGDALPISTAEMTDSAAFGNPTTASGARTGSFTHELFDGDMSVAQEPEDHTMVETKGASFIGVQTQVDGPARVDEWVVEDSITRAPAASRTSYETVVEDDDDPPTLTPEPLQSRFVAGEINSAPSAPTASVVVDLEDASVEGPNFTAMAPPLGAEADPDESPEFHRQKTQELVRFSELSPKRPDKT